MQRLLVQLLAVVIIAILGGLAYLHLNTNTSPVSSSTASSPASLTATSVPTNSLPTATATPEANPPAAPTPQAGTSSPGWGQTIPYIGSYRLTASSNTKLAGTGTLSISPGTISGIPQSEISGILSLPPPNQSNGSFLADFYLTGFAHSGMVRSARINLGSPTGPAVGTFTVKSYANKILVASITFQGEPAITLQFDHYTTNPHA